MQIGFRLCHPLPQQTAAVFPVRRHFLAGQRDQRAGGSAGGHNGLKSIIFHLGTDAFPRLRLGVGAPPHPDFEMIDWVLGRLSGEDEKLFSQAVEKATDAIECCVTQGIDKAMSLYNGK